MAILIFRLGGVPEQEADDVRALLDSHGFDVYETSAGRWKLSVAAIWLRDETQYAEARAVIDAYQAELVAWVRQQRAELDAEEGAPHLWQRLRDNPLPVLLCLVAAVAVLALSLLPFLAL
ncbi:MULTISPECIES: DUF6164 family protein [Halomonadaceae]|uniref:DUF6164 family protein n=1 Tax=Halomonadaceae TaxID=28256 RepID=UPI001599F6E8|nr:MULTISPECIES: DUF6164 family protein [Halomonas]QJQ94862.1 hypothetical protein HIO72_05935 [Halomonas sp. PA5]